MRGSLTNIFASRTATNGGFLKDSSILFASLTVANVSNYVFHVVMTRMLGPVEYGALGALFAVIFVVAVPMGAVQAVVARRAAAAREESELAGLLRATLRGAAIAGTAIAALLAVMAPLLTSFFHVDSVIPVLLVASFMIPAIGGPVGRGFLQGTMRFRFLGLSLVVATVLKLSLGVVFVRAGLGVTGAVAAVLIAEATAISVALLPARHLLFREGTIPFASRAVLNETGRVMLAVFAFWLLVTVDLMLMRYFHPTEISGRYAAATLLGRAVFFLPAAITVAVFPRFAADPGGAESRRVLVRAAALTVALSGGATLGIFAFPGLVSRLFGPEYVGAGAVGEVLALAMIGFGVVRLLMHFRIAERHAPIKTLFVALALEVIGITVAHESPTAVATIVLGVGVVLVGTLAAQVLRRPAPLDLRTYELGQATNGVDLTVVTPSFNGARHLSDNLTTLARALRQTNLRHEVIVVSDGSSDGTEKVAERVGGNGLRVIHYERNRGKGYALRTGLARARGRYVAFIDSDGDLDPAELRRFVELMDLYEPDLVVGSKRHPLSEVSYPPTRRVMSWGYHKLVRALFGIRVSDTQTGIKLIRRHVLAAVLPRLVEKRFAFDLELLVAARRLGYRRVLEAPVTLDYRFDSTVSARAVRGIILDTAAIWYRRYVLHWYDHAPGETAQPTDEPIPAPASSI